MFENSPFRDRLIRRGDPTITPYTQDSVIHGTPDAVFRPATIQEIQEITRYCAANRIPVTCCGSRTSMTGSSVTDSGLLLSLENLSGIIDLDTDSQFVTVRPGTILGEMQKTVEASGLYYPPSPTSRNECTVGATIITNATGDTTFKYGTSRRYVHELTIVTANGSLKTLSRCKPPPPESKNTAGYFLGGEEIDLVIGSEGTLGIVVEAKLKILEGVPRFMTFMIPFVSDTDALRFIVSHSQYATISPRTMEYVGAAAYDIMRTHPGFPRLSAEVRALVICQQEFPDGEEEETIDAWFSALSAVLTRMQSPSLLNSVIVARTHAEQDRMAEWRHHIPAAVAEQHIKLQENGGGKVGTDWWVPLPRMQEMMQWMHEQSDKLGIPYIAFGHLGNGHPHVNYLARNPEEKARAMALVMTSCRRAVRLGGGVAGEHGLGKIKRDLLAIQHPKAVIDRMLSIKRAWDPHWILGRGNIFTEE